MKDTTKSVAKAIDEQNKQGDENIITLSTGVELYVKQANPIILIKIMTKEKRPEPPMVFMKDMGRSMENPDDPDYISRVKAWEMNYNSAMLNALIGLGTSLKSKPKGLPGPDDDSWIADYKQYGLPTSPESKAWRYIAWVQFVAAPIDNDIKVLGEKVKTLSGVREEDVADAESFSRSD
jgi:hypothetical protein